MAIISSGITTLTDLNDAIISGTQPVNPTVGTLWIDSSKSPAILKIFKNGAWVTQDLDLNSLDPDTAESIRNVVATIGNMSNDNLLDYKERQIIKDDLTDILGKVMLDTETALPTVAQLDILTKGSFYSVRQNALNAGLEKTNSVYVETATQYQNLKTYLESLTPIKPWNVAVADKDKNVVVIKNTFRDKWLQYYLATEKLNLATTEKIKEAQEELDGKIDEVSLRDKTEILSGNPVFTDKSDDAVVHVGVDGKSEQGKNLLVNSEIAITNSSEYRIGFYPLSETPVLGESYTITLKGLLGSDRSGFGIYNSGGSVSLTNLISLGNGLYSASFLWKDTNSSGTVADNTSIHIYQMTSNATSTTSIEWIQMEKGTIFTGHKGFETHVPSTKYPSEIKSLDKSFDIVSSVGKENLLTGEPVNQWKDVSISASVGGVITRTLNQLGLKSGDEITWSVDHELGSYKLGLRFNFSPVNINNIGNAITGSGRASHTAIIPEGTTTINFWLNNNGLNGTHTANFNVRVRNSKIERGTPSPYSQPLSEILPDTQTSTLYKTNISLSEPLRSVGDVKDRLFLDTDGLWKVERNVREIVLKGSDIGLSAFDFTTNVFGLNLQGSPITYEQPISSSHFKFSDYSKRPTIKEGEMYSAPHSEALYMAHKSATLAAFRSWVDANNVTVQYQLATPTIETLSAEQQTKLNNIQSFKGSNYVYTFGNVVPNLNATFKSNMWYRMNVLGEKQVSGNRNWASNGNFAYLLEKSLWSGYYRGTVREIVDISTETPPFKNALHIKQTTSGVAGIIDAVIWEGAEANVLSGQNVSMATWLKYQNVATSELTMNVQVTGKKSDGTFVYDTYKAFSYTGTDATWKRLTGTVKLVLPAGAVEITRIVFRLGLAGSGTGEFWATGIQLETGNALGDWSTNPNDTEEELQKTEARFILTEKEVGLSVKKGTVVNALNVDATGVKIEGRLLEVNADTEFNANLTMNKGVIKSADGGTVLDLNKNTLSLDKPFSIGNTTSATVKDVTVVANDLNNLEIGGRQLILNTAQDFVYKNTGTTTTGADVTPGTNRYYATKDGSRVPHGTFFSQKGLTATDNLTFSGYIEVFRNDGAPPKLSDFQSNFSARAFRFPGNGSSWRTFGTIGYTDLSNGIWSKKINETALLGTNDSTVGVGYDNPALHHAYLPAGYGYRVVDSKIEVGTKATDWTPAPEEVDALITQAQTDATNAKNSASSANQLLADLSNDGILTPVEKKSVKKEWDIIVSEKAKIDAEATEYVITGTERTNYNTHYNSLNGYIPPLLANLNANSNIVGVNFRGYFKNYYDARQDILNAITSKAKALADSAQGTADVVKGVVSNFDSAIINANPIFFDWTGTLPAGYASVSGATMAKVTSGNGMGNAVRFTVATAGTNVYLQPSQVITSPFYEYVTIETTFKLDSGTIDGAGVLFRYNGTGSTDHHVNLKSIISSPTLNKWYTVTKVIRQATQPAGFTGYSVYPMGGWSSFGTVTTKVIQFDSMKARQATEQEINAYESGIMIADMSSDSKITPVEKVQLKKEWATINAERVSLDGLALTYGITTERTNMTTAYNTLNTVLNGAGGILLTMSSTSTVVATTFRAQFDDYYEKKAILQKKANELAKSYADSATDLANKASTLAGTKSETYTVTPTTPYKSGDVWKNGTAVYISTATRASGANVVADWVLVGDVTSGNTANDTSNVGGTASTTVRDRATNGNTAYASTSLWKASGKTTFNGGQIETDTIVSGAIKSDVALINKLFVSDANVNALTVKTAFITAVKAQTIDVGKITGNTSSFVQSEWNKLSSSVNIDAGGVTTTASSGAQTLLQNGVLYTKTPRGSGLGTIGYALDATEDLFSIDIIRGNSFTIRYQNVSGSTAYTDIFGYYDYLDRVTINKNLQINGDLNMNYKIISNVQSITSPKIDYMSGRATYVDGEYMTRTSYTGHRFYMNGFQAMVLSRNHATSGNSMSLYAGLNMQGYTITNQSDRRLKTNIKKSEKQALDSIKKWNFVEYEWIEKEKPQGNQFGLIAQDTPELMTFEEQDDYYGIDSSRQVMLNSKGIQELTILADEHENKFTELEEKYKLLKEKIEKIGSANNE